MVPQLMNMCIRWALVVGLLAMCKTEPAQGDVYVGAKWKGPAPEMCLSYVLPKEVRMVRPKWFHMMVPPSEMRLIQGSGNAVFKLYITWDPPNKMVPHDVC